MQKTLKFHVTPTIIIRSGATFKEPWNGVFVFRNVNKGN